MLKQENKQLCNAISIPNVSLLVYRNLQLVTICLSQFREMLLIHSYFALVSLGKLVRTLIFNTELNFSQLIQYIKFTNFFKHDLLRKETTVYNTHALTGFLCCPIYFFFFFYTSLPQHCQTCILKDDRGLQKVSTYTLQQSNHNWIIVWLTLNFCA